MLLWVGFAVLAAAVVAVLVRPLRAEGRVRLEGQAADLAVYRDQLAEIEADRERGLLGPEEAASAKAEVARRLLQGRTAHVEAVEPATRGTASVLSPVSAAAASVLAIPAIGIALYLWLGSPGLPGQPLASRGPAAGEPPSVAALVAKVEERLNAHPEDGRGWDVIAPVYMRLGRAADAATAYSNAIRLEGETVARLVGFAEATLVAGDGIVSEEVKRACERILVLEPARIEPRVWLALAKEQDGDTKGALADYRAMLAAAPADADWRGAVEERVARLEGRAPAQPTPGDVAAVERMPEADQAKFIESMVGRLATRLKENGDDLEGWQKLARAYVVLGRKDEAVKAVAEAKSHFAGNAEATAALEKLARDLGLATN